MVRTRHTAPDLHETHATILRGYHCLGLNSRHLSVASRESARRPTSTKLATFPSSSTPRVLNLAPARFHPKRLIKPRCTFFPRLGVPEMPMGTTPVKPWMTGTSMRSESSRSRHDGERCARKLRSGRRMFEFQTAEEISGMIRRRKRGTYQSCRHSRPARSSCCRPF